MYENELKHIGNQLAEMTERELNEVLLQLCNRKNFSSDFPREFVLYLEKVMETESFDCFGNIDEKNQAYWDEQFPNWKLYRTIEKKLRAITEILPFSLEISSGPTFILKNETHDLAFKVSPLDSSGNNLGTVEYNRSLFGADGRTIAYYSNESRFDSLLYEWIDSFNCKFESFHKEMHDKKESDNKEQYTMKR